MFSVISRFFLPTFLASSFCAAMSGWQHGAMTFSRQPESPRAPDIVVFDYAERGYRAWRGLWAELTEYDRCIYEDPSIGGEDPGAGFDGYLAMPQRIGTWLAESGGGAGRPDRSAPPGQ